MRFLGFLLFLLASAAEAAGPHIVVLGLMTDRAVVKIDGQQALLKLGEVKDGVQLVSVTAQEAVLKVGGREQRFGLGVDTGGFTARSSQSVAITMNGNGQFITSGLINGRVVEMLVDTGANTVSMTTADAKALGVDYRRLGTPAASQTAGGVVPAWRVTLDSVKVGGIVVRNVEASVREAPSLGPLLLGMSFLSQVNMTHEQNRLLLSTR